MERRSVLLVCTGNICRSPTAEGVLRAKAQARGLAERVRIASAGTHDYHAGEAPDTRAMKHATKRGYDLSKQRARQVSAEDFREFDYILAMDRSHLRWLRALAPQDASAGRDRQLETALQTALSALERSGTALPDFGPRPNLKPPALVPRKAR